MNAVGMGGQGNVNAVVDNQYHVMLIGEMQYFFGESH